MKRYYRRIAPLLSGNYILPSPAHCEISTPHLLSTMRPVNPATAPPNSVLHGLSSKSKFLAAEVRQTPSSEKDLAHTGRAVTKLQTHS